jgi:hypothetical protein
MAIIHHTHYHTYYHETDVCEILKLLKQILMNQAELAAELKAVKDQNEKSRAEVLAKFKALEDAIVAAGNTSPEVDAALADLKASVKADDDLIEDAPPADGPGL